MPVRGKNNKEWWFTLTGKEIHAADAIMPVRVERVRARPVFGSKDFFGADELIRRPRRLR